MQELSYKGKIALVSLWFKIVFTPIITPVDKEDTLTLTYPPNITKYQYLVRISIPMGRFFNTMIHAAY